MVAWRRRLLVALLFYGGLGIVLTWPLAAHLTTHVAGDGIDDPALAWNLWWIKARLLDQHQLDIFHVDWMSLHDEFNSLFALPSVVTLSTRPQLMEDVLLVRTPQIPPLGTRADLTHQLIAVSSEERRTITEP